MLKRIWLRIERCFLFNTIRLFRIREQSEKVARGFALGIIVNFLPTFGFGVLFSGVLARVLGGNTVAGLVGGASLTFFWPVLFYLNIRTGGILMPLQVPVEHLEQVTEQTVSAFVWGRAFTVGAIINMAVCGAAAYGLLRLLYHEIRLPTLNYFRHHAREHQRRFGKKRLLAMQ